MPPVQWTHLPDPCLLSVFKHFTLIELFCTVRLVCSRWSLVVSSELNQVHTLVIAYCYKPQPCYVRNLDPSILLKHLRHEDGKSPLMKYRPPIDERSIVKYSNDKIRLRKSFVAVFLKNLPNITNLTLMLGSVDKSKNAADCELTQLICILTHWRKNLVSLNLSILGIQYGERRKEINVQTLFNSINRLESLKNLSLDLRIHNCEHKPKLTILSQLKTFNFTANSHPDFQMAMLNHVENEKNQFSDSCEIGYEVQYWRYEEQGSLEFEKIARFDPKFASKFVTLSVLGEFGLKCYENLQMICTKFTSLKRLDLSTHHSISMSMLARCLSQLPQLTHLKLRIEEYHIPNEETPVQYIAQVLSVRLLTLQIYTQSHRETAHLNLAHIFPNLQVLDLWHSSKICTDCNYDYHTFSSWEFSPENVDKLIKPEKLIIIAQCMHKAKEPFRECVQLHTVEFNNWPSRLYNRKLVSKEKYFSEQEIILSKQSVSN